MDIVTSENPTNPNNPGIITPGFPARKKSKKKEILDSIRKFFTLNIISLSLVKIMLVMLVWGAIFFVGGAYFLQNGALTAFMRSSAFESLVKTIKSSVEECRLNSSAQAKLLESCQQDLKIETEKSGYDKVRIADATNILLSMQNYNFDKGVLPASLQVLGQEKYYSGNTSDPESGIPYFYKKIDKENYIFCVYLSTGIWGTNRSQCPDKESYLATGKSATSTGEIE